MLRWRFVEYGSYKEWNRAEWSGVGWACTTIPRYFCTCTSLEMPINTLIVSLNISSQSQLIKEYLCSHRPMHFNELYKSYILYFLCYCYCFLCLLISIQVKKLHWIYKKKNLKFYCQLGNWYRHLNLRLRKDEKHGFISTHTF